MRLIDLEELSYELDYFISQVGKIYVFDLVKWKTVAQTGCRIHEALDTSRWIPLSDLFQLQPQKLNNTRDIPFSSLSTDVIDYILEGNQNQSSNNYNRYVHQFHKEFGSKKFFIGDKGCSTHLFRHRIVKEKKQILGWSDSEIKVWLGEKTQIATNSYIYSEIYVNF